MKTICLSLAALALALATFNSPALAIAPFSNAFKDKYVKPGAPLEEKVAKAKCNVCHLGKNRKNRNEYGKAVQLYLKKADFAGKDKKYDPKSEEGQKLLFEGLEKASAEKNADGKIFLELITAGELPAGSE